MNTDGLPVFVGQLIDSSLVASQVALTDINDPKAIEKFQAMQFAKAGHCFYGVLTEDPGSLGKIRRDEDIRQVYDRFDQATLDASKPLDMQVILPVMFYTAGKAAELVNKAKALVPFGL